MSAFVTLAPVYSMPAVTPGDVDLPESSSKDRARALNQFLASVELKAFKIAQIALRHEDDALDAVQDAMLQLARAYGERPGGGMEAAVLPHSGKSHPRHAAPAHGPQPRHVLAAVPARAKRMMSRRTPSTRRRARSRRPC